MTEPSRGWKENIAEGEPARLEHFAEQLRDLQRKRARAKRRPASRALHAKGQAPVEAELTILPDLPEHARVGLFAAPKTFRAYVRFSNGGGVRAATPSRTSEASPSKCSAWTVPRSSAGSRRPRPRTFS